MEAGRCRCLLVAEFMMDFFGSGLESESPVANISCVHLQIQALLPIPSSSRRARVWFRPVHSGHQAGGRSTEGHPHQMQQVRASFHSSPLAALSTHTLTPMVWHEKGFCGVGNIVSTGCLALLRMFKCNIESSCFGWQALFKWWIQSSQLELKRFWFSANWDLTSGKPSLSLV